MFFRAENTLRSNKKLLNKSSLPLSDELDSDHDAICSLQQKIIQKINKDCQSKDNQFHHSKTSFDHSSPTK